MDVSVLPNSNHPERLLQLDVGMLDARRGLSQVGAIVSSQRRWHNRVYWQREQTAQPGSQRFTEGRSVAFVDRYLEKHITPVTLKSNIKTNPLYLEMKDRDMVDSEEFRPSWTIQEYDSQTIHGNLADYSKDEKSAKDLDFWLEDLYTPGFDSLLKRKEAEQRRKRLSRILPLVVVLLCVCLAVIIVPVLLNK
ncbi:major intrinsically disordered NOTCH2-binding receptor 1-like [Cyprinodon tularosa]|uniref:major intrinsically disordered NOTCH2-binding receptor 1-like n=1 Tax=Cyprinodon tularosa TaxID=77115 RepID=UPI0018E1DA25|nr:major intrinsically disordered NOTCH2-binding receptor 1-like [Cyprinodon tularosa]